MSPSWPQPGEYAPSYETYVSKIAGDVVLRVFAYRALRIARDDQPPKEGFEQDDYVRAAPFACCSLLDLLEEFTHVRRASLVLFRPLEEAAWLRRGVANKNEVTVRAVAYIIAGHLRHH